MNPTTNNKKLTLILPKGSLNTPGRGNTEEFLSDAGYDLRGYTPKAEETSISIRNDTDLECELARPQTALLEFRLGAGDCAILGTDWVREGELLYGVSLEKVADLGYGGVRIVAAVQNGNQGLDKLLEQKDKLRIWSEFIGITKEMVTTNAVYQKLYGSAEPVRFAKGLTDGTNTRVQIYLSDGETERFVTKGLGDMIVDVTQTGSTLRKFGLTITETIMQSEAGLYASPSALQDPWKKGKITELAAQLEGVKRARENYMVTFNVPEQNLQGVITYLQQNKLCGKEPTVIPGGSTAQVQSQMPRGAWIVAARTLREEYGASDIQRYEPKQILG